MDTQGVISQQYENFRGTERDTQNFQNKPQDSSVTNAMNLRQFVERGQVEELINLLEKEKIQKASLNVGLNLALLNCRSHSDMLEIIDILLNQGADVNYHIHNSNKSTGPRIEEKDNVTILMYACLKGDLQLIHTILKHRPNINLKDKHNKNALLYAIIADKGDNVDVVLTLIREGVEVNDSGKVEHIQGIYYTHSPLTLATAKNMKNTVQILIENGANVNFKMLPDEDTAMHIAVRNGNLDIIHCFLSTKTVNLSAINREGKTSYDLAVNKSQTEIYRILIERLNMNANKEKETVNELIAESNLNNFHEVRKKKKNEACGNVNSNAITQGPKVDGNLNVNFNRNSNINTFQLAHSDSMGQQQKSKQDSPDYSQHYRQSQGEILMNSNLFETGYSGHSSDDNDEIPYVEYYSQGNSQMMTGNELPPMLPQKGSSPPIPHITIPGMSNFSNISSMSSSPNKKLIQAANLVKCVGLVHNKKKIKEMNRKYMNFRQFQNGNPTMQLEIPIEFRDNLGVTQNLNAFISI